MTKGSRLADILLAVYTASALLFLSLPAGPWVRAFKSLLAYSLAPGLTSGSAALQAFGGLKSRWGELLRADLDNRELRAQLEAAGLAQEEARAVLSENAKLREQLGLRARVSWKFKSARVVERDPAAWFSSVMIDKGDVDGMKPGAAAFALEGGRLVLVGRVIEAAPDSARVLLLTDPLSSVAAAIAPAGWQGLVEGQGGNALRMNFLPVEALPRVGDEVLTSPASPTFPPNVLIGTVSRVLESDPYLPYRLLEVRPAASPAKLSLLLIRQ